MAGTVTFSNSSGTCKYTNPDGEELTFGTATGSFSTETKLENTGKGTLQVVWKPMGKKKAKDTVEVLYGVGGEKGVYQPRQAVEADDEEE